MIVQSKASTLKRNLIIICISLIALILSYQVGKIPSLIIGVDNCTQYEANYCTCTPYTLFPCVMKGLIIYITIIITVYLFYRLYIILKARLNKPIEITLQPDIEINSPQMISTNTIVQIEDDISSNSSS